MAEIIGCRNCDSPDCRGCNVYILDQALSSGRLDGLKDDKKTIRIPTAGVRPVVRGEWIPYNPSEDGFAEHFQCSNCKTWYQMPVPNRTHDFDYCPHCSADMRGGGNGM